MNGTVTSTLMARADEESPEKLRVQCCNLSLSFGGQRVLDDVSFELREGELVLLRGENGAGKTTLLNLLSGYLLPDRGSVKLRTGKGWIDTTAARPDRLARLGLGRLWQDIRLFPSLTVIENVLAATPNLIGVNPLLAIAAMPKVHRQEREARERGMRNLALVGLQERAQSSCEKLSVGQMKRVAIARLLQMEAALFLLDEPLAGLDTVSATALVRDLGRLRTEQGKTLLIIEHQYERIAPLADRVWVLSQGRIEESRGSCG